MKSNIEYIQHMGDDRTVANAARVSFDKDLLNPMDQVSASDISLIQYLARGCSSGDWEKIEIEIYEACGSDDRAGLNQIMKRLRRMPLHWTPFGHTVITLRETLPIFIARQRTTHHVGVVYNEISRRYVDDAPETFEFESFRARPNKSIKQGSGEVHPESPMFVREYERHMRLCKNIYESWIQEGVAPEQARAVLPMSMMTSFWVTGSLYSFANAYNARSDSHAQEEIQDVAAQWKAIIKPLYPIAWEALTE